MKKQISAKIIADSKNKQGDRITTFVLTFPRFILAEFNTHRVFSRNSASSRAIPFKKMVKMVQEDPFIPIAWQKDHKGMQGFEYHEGSYTIGHKESIWLSTRDKVIDQACKFHNNDVTKQLCNRLLEPFMWHTVIVTATEFENFFKQRCPQYFCEESGRVYRSRVDFCENETGVSFPKTEIQWHKCNKGQGEIHLMALAEAMWDALNENKPKQLKSGEWHVPFGDKFNENKIFSLNNNQADHKYWEWFNQVRLKIATARCARISYLNLEGRDDYEADIKLHDRLLVEDPIHGSPAEHCARAMSDEEYYNRKGKSRNFKGFVQYRELIENN